jgi:type II secretory pathway pseudopilin PulG
MTTVAIVGVISAIAVPNFMRMKAGANMEKVKQHLKRVGGNLNDMLNRDNVFPNDLLNLGDTEEEISITGSMTAIDQLQYQTDGYFSLSRGTNYTSRWDPTPAARNAGLDKCFILTTLGVGDADCASLDGFVSFNAGGSNSGAIFSTILSDRSLSDGEKAQILAQFFELLGAAAEFYRSRILNLQDFGVLDRGGSLTQVPSQMILMNTGDAATFNALIPKVREAMGDKGLEILITERSQSHVLANANLNSDNIVNIGGEDINVATGMRRSDVTSDKTYFEIGFRSSIPLAEVTSLTNQKNQRTKKSILAGEFSLTLTDHYSDYRELGISSRDYYYDDIGTSSR